MSDDEVVEETLAAYFAIQEQQWDSANYPYWADYSKWADHSVAHSVLTSEVPNYHHNPKRWRIALIHLDAYNTGRVLVRTKKVVYDEGEWVSVEHDPRSADPQFREYMRLKAIYEED